MKSGFLKMLLAVLLGLLIGWIVKLVFWGSVIGVMSSSASGTVPVRDNSVLVIDMSTFVLDEQSASSFGSMNLMSGTAPTVGILDAVTAIYAAADDARIKCIYLKPDAATSGYAQIQELRAALEYFRSRGKSVVAYTCSPDNAGYYLATVADKLYMTSDHGGNNSLIGVAGRMIFLKDILDKAGVNVQLIRHGKYKSAGEMYIRNSSSEENLEQNRRMVTSIWESISVPMAAARGIQVDALNAMVDSLSLVLPEDFLSRGLVDGLLDKEGMAGKLVILSGVKDRKDLRLIAFPDYIKAAEPSRSSRQPKVAVLFANGEIVDGGVSLGGGAVVDGDSYADMIEAIRTDESVKAVVFRVNSPGGSVLASSKIKNALDRLCETKPVVASYGNYAASGGYWISNACETIFSNATTLTGSIGVFSMIPDFSKTASDLLHVNVTTVGSNAHSDMFSLMRPFDDVELAAMQTSVDDIYTQFVSLVSKGRGLESEFVDSVAQGRVWTGADALEIRLVDHIGTLQDALAYAMDKAGGPTDLGAWNVVQYPAPLSLTETLAAMIGGAPVTPTILGGTPFESLADAFEDFKLKDPKKVYALLPYEVDLK